VGNKVVMPVALDIKVTNGISYYIRVLGSVAL